MRLRQVTVATPEIEEDYFDEKLAKRVQKIRLKEPSSKLDTVMEIIEGLEWDEESKQPLVVFSCFKDPLELLKTRLDEAGISYIHLEQKDNDQERKRKWLEEFPKMNHRVFMSTLQLGGESINLTPARHVVFLDRSWSPKDNSQGIGRLRRPGQEGQPVVINVNGKHTTDQRIESVVMQKQSWFNELFGKDESITDDMEEMLAA
jgi:SNF2 family DNA or RNA helicase